VGAFQIQKGLNIFDDIHVKGDLYINQVNIELLPKKYLSSYYDVTRFGSVETDSTTTNYTRYDTANRQISNMLSKVFTPNNDSRYSVESEVIVACDFTKMVTATNVTSTVTSGSTVVPLTTTSNISAGALVQGSLLLPVGTIVEIVNTASIVLNLPVMGDIPQGTVLSFNTVTTDARLFTLTNLRQWQPHEIYTRGILGATGSMTVGGPTASTITVNGTQTSFTQGLRIEFVAGSTPQPTIGLTTITNIIVNTGTTTTNLVLQTQGLGVAGAVTFNAHPAAFIATYTNIVA
jgi:hypothetical protein